jgi:hypothetical protein
MRFLSWGDAIHFDLILDQALEWDSGPLLKGHLAWTDERLETRHVVPSEVSIRDAAGQWLDFNENFQYIELVQLGSR